MRSRSAAVKVQGTLAANSVIAPRDAARVGVGVALLPTYCAAANIADGTLRRLLSGWRIAERPLYAVYPYGVMPPQKVRLFAEFMARWFRNPPRERTKRTIGRHNTGNV